ncbi:MAG: peptidase M52, partial [Actinomycetota bacterium]|nr:peptidase M52 [Actinomycetota bacterium]
ARTLVVACEPADTGEGIGFSEPVAAAVDAAVEMVRELLTEQLDLEVAKEH